MWWHNLGKRFAVKCRSVQHQGGTNAEDGIGARCLQFLHRQGVWARARGQPVELSSHNRAVTAGPGTLTHRQGRLRTAGVQLAAVHHEPVQAQTFIPGWDARPRLLRSALAKRSRPSSTPYWSGVATAAPFTSTVKLRTEQPVRCGAAQPSPVVAPSFAIPGFAFGGTGLQATG